MRFRSKHYALAIVCVLSGALSPTAQAIDERWSVSFSLGGVIPNFKALDDGIFKSPFTGTATVLVSEGGTGSGSSDGTNANQTETIPFRYEANLPPINMAAQGGVEFYWHANERHAFLFGISSMEHSAVTRSVGNIPLQQYFASNVVESERRGKISYTEYSLGWRYNAVRHKRFQLYTRLSIHEVFDIDYRDDFVFLFQESPIPDLLGVRRDMVAQAQTASLFMGQIGGGAEWFLRDWLSVGLEGGYVLGQSSVTLGDVQLRDDFQASDGVSRTGFPFRRMADGTLGYLVSTATPDDLESAETRESFYRSIRLRFDSWRVLLRLNLYF